jgi:hypothetical protein
MAFLLDAADRVLHGARWYVDVVEINPPLIIALNVPAVVLGHWLGISPITVYRIGFALGLGGALWLCARRLRELDIGAEREWLLLTIAFVLFPLPGEDFGEREHLLLALLLPYLLLSVGRADGRTVRWTLAAGVGGLAAVAFALKPHFLVVWAAVELYLVGRGRRRPAPESLAVAGVLATYAVLVVALVPAYLRLVALLSVPYLKFLYDPALHLLVTAPGVPVVYLALLAFAALRRNARHPRLWEVLAIATAAAFVAGVLQQKGLSYHFLPATGLGVLLLATMGLDTRRVFGSWVPRVYWVAAGSALAATVVTTLGRSVASGLGRLDRPREEQLDRMVALVRRHAAGEPVLVLSYHIESSYPLINYSSARSASRFPQLWILPAEYFDALHEPAPLRFRPQQTQSPAERYLREAVVSDLEASDPKLIIVLRHARDIPENGLRRLDYLTYFRQDPRFADRMDRYQWLADVGEFTVFERLNAGASRTTRPAISTPGVSDVLREDREGLHLRLGSPEFLLGLVVFAIAATILARRQGRGAG